MMAKSVSEGEQGLEDGVPLDQPYLEIDEAEWPRGGGGGGKERGGGRKGRLRGRGVPGGQTDGVLSVAMEKATDKMGVRAPLFFFCVCVCVCVCTKLSEPPQWR
jgi:hypothetical protein